VFHTNIILHTYLLTLVGIRGYFGPLCIQEVQWSHWTEVKTTPPCWRYTRCEQPES